MDITNTHQNMMKLYIGEYNYNIIRIPLYTQVFSYASEKNKRKKNFPTNNFLHVIYYYIDCWNVLHEIDASTLLILDDDSQINATQVIISSQQLIHSLSIDTSFSGYLHSREY